MASEVLKIDSNNKVVAGFVTDDANQFIRNARIDDATKGLKVMIVGGVGAGTVTSVSVVSANGFAGTVATATTTPAITLSTTITGLLQGNGTAISSVTIGSGLSFAGGTLSATGSGLTVGTTTITSGTTTRILYDNAGVLGEYTISGSGTVVAMATSPSFTTPTLGVASATTINKVTITAPATGSTLTIADGKTLTANNSITIAGTDTKTLTVNNNLTFSGTDGKTLTLTNGLTVTTNDGTLAFGAASKTLTVNKSLTLDGTDSTTMTFPSTSATIARTDAAQTFTGTQTFSQTILTANAITAVANAATVPVTSGRNIVTNNSAAGLTITMATAGAVSMQTCIVQILPSSAVAQTLTFVNTENSAVTSVPANTGSSTTIPISVGFIYNNATSKWTCVASS